MQAKTLIAVAVATLLAAPVALAQTASGGTGPTGDQRSADDRTPTKTDQEKSATGRSTGPKAKAKTSKREKRDAERISRNDRGTTADSSPNMARNPRTPGNPPKQGGSPEPR